LIELVSKNIIAAKDAETNIIDWIFEKGVPDHLTKEEVLNVLYYNLNIVTKDLGLDFSFDFDADLYEQKNKWFMEKIMTTGEPDFFDCPVGGYASDDEEVDLDNFKF
jgi:hypothetical protein